MRIVVKIGSALISRGCSINYNWIGDKIKEISALMKAGHEVVLVSSGSVAAGMEVRNVKVRPKDTVELQLLSGQGQVKLMEFYRNWFRDESIFVAQILVTHHNFATSKEKQSVHNIIEAYLKRGILPIMNENDLVNKEELDYERLFTDNDILSSLIAKEMEADLLLMLTDVDGLYDGNPKKDKSAKLIELVEKIDDSVKDMATPETNSLGLGGMISKVTAAETCTKAGIDTIVASGHKNLTEIINGLVPRTLFKA
ncbi:glutamate 5-kinase [Thiospirochaeta perfilievii]|uniref:Glutamate 5-kinase n=1 Tax=Thiospirochaeta perfilievii TaxID=252967 RepID=A0A5C1QER8_9SPIO|nr:glutamate 5-kinase [Thiospirochaeta perfilievii]QEN05509.1 glutamate 5-kinase [Thiospirochaeta perfilievii]